MPRFHIINFGCRANQADGDSIANQLLREGYEAHSEAHDADVVVLNSCTVTSGADYSLRNATRRIRRENPSAQILVTGCYAQRSPEAVAAIDGVDAVVGNSHKDAIGRLAIGSMDCGSAAVENAPGSFVPLSAIGRTRILHSDISQNAGFPHELFADEEAVDYHSLSAATEHARDPLTHSRTRPNLKIQDGCNHRCSFCIIPSVRGRSRSMTEAAVIKKVTRVCQEGAKEVVLSGINLGQYGMDFSVATPSKRRSRFYRLIETILEETPVERLRLSSVEPMDFSDELLRLMASTSRIADHVHAPLQSGADRVLRLMHRKYRAARYRERLEAAFQLMPNAAFGADVMVGFPGESDEDFEQTRKLIEELPFTYLHVFPYSRRPGTPADRLPDQIHGSIVRERTQILRRLSDEKNARFRERQIGLVLDVVTLDGAPAIGERQALSGNFLPVAIEGTTIGIRNRLPVLITGTSSTGLLGCPASNC